MTDVIDVVVKESGSAQVVASFDSIAAAAQRAHTSVSALQKLLGNVGRSTAAANRITALGTAAQVTTGHISNLNSALNALNNTRVTASLNSANQALKGTSTHARNAATAVRDLLGAFMSFQTIRRVVKSLVDAQVTMQRIHYGLLSATGSAAGAAAQFEYLRENANRLGLDLRTSAQEYTRLAAAANAMNVEVEDQQKLYTALSQASTVLHLDAQRVQFATLALTQMFSKGKIQAEELRRQLGEAIPGVVPRFQQAVMRVVQGTDLAKYSFEELMKRGLLDTKKFLPQLIEALSETGRGWEEASKGLNAELNRLKTAWFELKNSLSEGIFNDAMIAVVRFLSSSLKELTGIVAGLGVAIATALAPAAIIKFIGYVKMLATAVWAAAGPWGILIGVVAGVIGYITTMRDEIKLGVDEVTTLGDMMRAAWSNLVPVLQSVGEFIDETLGGIFRAITGTFNELINRATGYEHENEALWLRVLRVIARIFDMIGAVIRGTFMGAIAVVKGFVDAFINNFRAVGSVVDAIKSGDIEGIKTALKSNLQGYKDAALNAGEVFGKAFQAEVLRQSSSGLESVLDNWIAEAQAIAKKRTEIPGTDPLPPPPPPPGGGDSASAKGAKELEKLKEALSRVIAKISPTEAATRELAEAQEVLNKATEKGLITQERNNWVMERLRDKFKDVLDPVGALVDKYREEREVLQYVGDEQEIQNIILSRYLELKKKNYDITLEYVENALRPEIEATMAATRANQAYNQVLQQTVYAQRSQIEMLKAISAAKAKGDITEGQAAQQLIGIFGEDAMAGTAEMYAAQLQQYQDFLAKVDMARQQNLISEQTANALALKSWADLQAAKLAPAEAFFGSMAQLMQSNNAQAFRIGQAAAIAETTINTYKAATAAYAAMAGIPVVGPALGAAAAAAAVVAGMAQISKIRSQTPPSFRTGGSIVVGGSGGIDSQLVQFNATPGEIVTINTPAQANAMHNIEQLLLEDRQQRGRGNLTQNVTIVQQGKPNNRTPEQEARAMFKAGRKLVKLRS